MKRIGIVLLLGCSLQSWGEPVTAMTFNVRYPSPQDLNEKSWDIRKDLVVGLINDHKPDFLGSQEIVAEYLPFLEEHLSDYAHVGRFRKGDGDRFDECSKIFYLKDKWELIGNDYGSFQLSDTPEIVGSRDWTSMARVTSWGRFRRIGTDETLYVYNTHWDHRTGRDESSLLCADQIANRKVPTDPVIFMGDFNRYQKTNPIRHLLGEKVYDRVPPISMVDTDHGTQKIDHIFVWPNSTRVIEGRVIRERFEVGEYKSVRPSDHDPSLAVVDFGAGYNPKDEARLLKMKRPVKRPNVVLILADDLGYGDLACYEQDAYETPAIDRMAAEGVLAEEFYVPVPYCAPSRASLLTGRHPFRTGMTRNPHPGKNDDYGLNPDEITLAEVLRDAGYATTCIGKWHLGHIEEFWPTKQGFDSYFGIPYSNDMIPVQVWNNREVVENPAEQTLLTKSYTDKAVDFIQQHAARPFFLYLPHAMPHKPLAASDDFYTPDTPDDLYADVIRELDWSVGQIFQTLETEGLLDNTIFIFISDNGPHYGGSTGGLKGKKATSWEGGVRVPFIIRYPQQIKRGFKSETPVWSLDVFPTVLALAGVDYPKGVRLDGRDITGTLNGGKRHASTIYTAHNEKLITVRSGDWKLFLEKPRYLSKRDLNPDYVDPVWPNGTTITGQNEQPTSMAYPGIVPKPFENENPLFNVKDDPTESTDVAQQHPEVVKRLENEAKAFLESMGAVK